MIYSILTGCYRRHAPRGNAAHGAPAPRRHRMKYPPSNLAGSRERPKRRAVASDSVLRRMRIISRFHRLRCFRRPEKTRNDDFIVMFSLADDARHAAS